MSLGSMFNIAPGKGRCFMCHAQDWETRCDSCHCRWRCGRAVVVGVDGEMWMAAMVAFKVAAGGGGGCAVAGVAVTVTAVMVLAVRWPGWQSR